MTFEARITFRAGTGTGYYQLFTCSDATYFGIEVRPSTGAMRIQAKDSANTVVVALTTVAGVLLAQDSQQTIRAAINYAAGQQWLRLFVNGTQVANQAFSVAGNGNFTTNRNLMFFQNTHAVVADIEYLRVWKSATTTSPSGSPAARSSAAELVLSSRSKKSTRLPMWAASSCHVWRGVCIGSAASRSGVTPGNRVRCPAPGRSGSAPRC